MQWAEMKGTERGGKEGEWKTRNERNAKGWKGKDRKGMEGKEERAGGNGSGTRRHERGGNGMGKWEGRNGEERRNGMIGVGGKAVWREYIMRFRL